MKIKDASCEVYLWKWNPLPGEMDSDVPVPSRKIHCTIFRIITDGGIEGTFFGRESISESELNERPDCLPLHESLYCYLITQTDKVFN